MEFSCWSRSSARLAATSETAQEHRKTIELNRCFMPEKPFYISPEDKTNKGDQAGPKHHIFLFDHRPPESQDGERNRPNDNGNAVQMIERDHRQSQKGCCDQTHLEDAYNISDDPACAPHRPGGRKKLKSWDSHEEVEGHPA